jgi:hypothetical protein
MTSLLLLPAFFALALSPSQSFQGPPTSKDNKVVEFKQDPIALPEMTPNSGTAVCLKMRMFIFERSDDAAPKFVRETTCGPMRPRLHQSKQPKARLVPAN